MSADQSQSNEACCATTANECADVNASCRLPVLQLFFGAACWLVVSSALALLASIKLHAPNFMGDCPFFTYAHVHAAHLNALAYGFAAQAALGVTLWLLAQTGKTKLALPGGALIAAKLWNLGVLVGVGSIFAGKQTGFEFLEFSQAGSVILLVAYVILALAGLLTFAKRTASDCVSQWFLVTALFWFPWIYLTATTLLGCMPVRGVTQAVIAWWFTNNFLFVWLGLICIGALFHFAPKFAGRQLHSRQLALFSLALLISFGSWAGIPASAPVPAWLPALSAFGAFISVVAVIGVMVNLYKTLAGCQRKECDVAGKFFCKSVPALALFAVANALASKAHCAGIVNFTWFMVALNYLLLYGFVAMVLLGAIYYIAPRLAGVDYCCTKPIKAHFWLMLLGTIFLVGSLTLAGKTQGNLLNQPNVAFADVTHSAMKFFRMSTLGDLLILLGSFALVLSLVGLLRAACKKCCGESNCSEVSK
jgi:cytochrome c oxidase cbb3-type subunit 1